MTGAAGSKRPRGRPRKAPEGNPFDAPPTIQGPGFDVSVDPDGQVRFNPNDRRRREEEPPEPEDRRPPDEDEQ